MMGLDISSYNKIEKVDCVFDANGDPIDPVTREPLDYSEFSRLFANTDFPGRAEEIEDGAVYRFEHRIGFCAGSYNGYNNWRNQLAQLAGYPARKYESYGGASESHCVACWEGAGGPFSELINFSDCEGVIGAAVSRKLAADFAEFQARAGAHPDEYFRRKYAEWRTAFELAADGGCVEFH